MCNKLLRSVANCEYGIFAIGLLIFVLFGKADAQTRKADSQIKCWLFIVHTRCNWAVSGEPDDWLKGGWKSEFDSYEKCIAFAEQNYGPYAKGSWADENCEKWFESYCEPCAKSKPDPRKSSSEQKNKRSGANTDSQRPQGQRRSGTVPQNKPSDAEEAANTILQAAPGIQNAIDRNKEERKIRNAEDRDFEGKPEGYHSDDPVSDDEWGIPSKQESDADNVTYDVKDGNLGREGTISPHSNMSKDDLLRQVFSENMKMSEILGEPVYKNDGKLDYIRGVYVDGSMVNFYDDNRDNQLDKFIAEFSDGTKTAVADMDKDGSLDIKLETARDGSRNLMNLEPPKVSGSDNIAVTFKAEISTGWDNPLGHIWVQFDDAGTFGFYPAGDGIGFFVPGVVADDSWKKANVSYTFHVSEEAAQRGLQVIESYRRQHYSIFTQNCKDMVYDVAVAMGLKTPSSFLASPAELLAKLVDAN